MPRTRLDRSDVVDVLSARECVATHRELEELGVSRSAITRRIGPHGPWQRLLPGVVLAHRGTPTRRERVLGALAFAGGTSVVSGADALVASDVRNLDLPDSVLVLVHESRQRRSFDFARLERTTRLPTPTTRRGIPYAPPARALVDLCRFQKSLTDIRATVAAVVQQRRTTVTALGDELRRCPRQRSAGARLALSEVADGVRSIAEARARTIIREAGLPPPLWNAQLVGTDGAAFLRPDAWWPDHGAALEIDSRKWHLSPDAWLRTQQRQRRLTAHGVMVMSFSPSEIVDDPAGFVREIRALLTAAMHARSGT
jgi:hypothetical protein